MAKRRLAVVLVWTLPSVLFLAVTAIVYAGFRIPPPDRLDDTERGAVMATLRAAVERAPAVPCTLRRSVAGRVAVVAWSNGRSFLRVDGEGGDLCVAVEAAATQLRERAELERLMPVDRRRIRIQVDVVTGTGPLGGGVWLYDVLAIPGIGEMLPINPGVEGIAVERDGKRAYLLPHELVSAKVLAAKKPSPALQDFAMGADLAKMGRILAAKSGIGGQLGMRDLFRFRTDTFVERAHDQREVSAPLQLYRGVPTPPTLTAQVLRDYALEGGRYLVAHLGPNGRYIYEHDISTGAQTDLKSPSYSMPRHAGTTYFLAELYRITKEPWLREPIERAFAHLAELMKNGKCTGTLPDGTEIDCVMDRTERVAQMGSTALTVVALAEYQRATGDTRYLPIATKLASWILWMQRADGSFRHLYDPKTKLPDEKAQLLYYTGEAALAMARMHAITNDARYAQSAERALDWSVDWYDFFMGGFIYGEEHWTCIAAEAAYPFAKKPKYRDFCHGYGKFLRAQQASLGDHPDQDDFAGAYVFTPFLVPYNTPAGSRTEAMVSAYLLGKHHGTPDDAVRGQIRAALQYALGQQITPDNDFAVIGAGRGGMPGNPIDRTVRIDYVQHVCSAFVRASEWIDGP